MMRCIFPALGASRSLALAVLVLLPVIGRAQAAVRDTAPAWIGSSIHFAELRFERARRLRDQIDVTRAMGSDTSVHGVPLDALEARYAEATDSLVGVHALIPPGALTPSERKVLLDMYAAAARELKGLPPRERTAARLAPACTYDAHAVIVQPGGADSLMVRILTCYGVAARTIVVGGDTLDRLSVIGRLSHENDPAVRELLWKALDPVWRSVNGANDSNSPWRQLIAARANEWRRTGLPVVKRATEFGLRAVEAEQWLVRALDAWRRATPDSLIEPWDWYDVNGIASRALSDRVSRASLRPIAERYYASLGADVRALNVRFDLEARPGKKPVSYTTFGDRPRWTGTAWDPGEPTIVATYREGGLDNLNELIHEVGHAVHIAGIRTRPGYADWPDSDPFTEGIADIVALDVYEPAWQQRWLGAHADTVGGLRGRYGGIMLDIAWALFEIRMHRAPAQDPNVLWTSITTRYLHITPHPERSWWAMRAQLFDLPGYMLNYALGAFLVADVRETLRARHGDWTMGDDAWYSRMRDQFYRFGTSLPAREVVTRFLGRPVRADAMLRDLARMRATR